MEFLFQSASSSQSILKESALVIFEYVRSSLVRVRVDGR